MDHHGHVERSPQGTAGAALETFVACAWRMLDAATPEARRREAEVRLLAQLPVLRGLGVFELFSVRDPALAELLRDELEQLEILAEGDEPGKCRA